ncbi:MAG: ribosome hibernation-promoting factor, HPF/YfiA family [Luteimonas sp.]
MHVETHGHQLEVTPALRDQVDTKFQKLANHFDQPLHVRVQLSVEKLLHKAEATAIIAGKTLHADATADDMYAAIDQLADKVDRLLVKHRKKVVDHHRGENPARDGTFG